VAGRGAEVHELSDGWEVGGCEPDACPGPEQLDRLDWIPAQVPGTAGSALRAAGLWEPGDARDLDDEDWWFRLRFAAERAREDERLILALDGIATVAEVYLNGEQLTVSPSMFVAHRLDVTGKLGERNELAIRCLALKPLLKVSRRPRARWRTKLVSDGNLRFFRTMLIGRTPGFTPRAAVVGPWKPVRLERLRGISGSDLRVRTRLDGRVGHVSVHAGVDLLAADVRLETASLVLSGPTGEHRTELIPKHDPTGVTVAGELAVDGAERWWPHTHGTPAVYHASLELGAGDEQCTIDAGRVGFRSLAYPRDLELDGIQLVVNGTPVFARGAVWTPLDVTRPCSLERDLRPVLAEVVDAGMNMLRVPGIGCYESDAFYDACDELGILVWQDFMFANMDYPAQDDQFMAIVRREAQELLEALAPRPSLAVLCGGSEVAQQAAMLGLDPSVAGGPLYDDLMPSAIKDAGLDTAFVPSTPWGGDLPFRPDRGVANYYGVGAYLRPLADARLSEVRFAAECLAFSNLPDEDALEPIQVPGGLVPHHPRWKAGVPRDVGAGWDFEDVRDHYLRLLYGHDPVVLRSTDPDGYMELSRQVTGEVVAEVFGEWRRVASPCAGGLVLWLTDVRLGAGWGLLDHRGLPKVAYHHMRRACAPVAVWTTDEGLGGVAVHVANDRLAPVDAVLRIATYRDFAVRVDEVEEAISLDPHGSRTMNVETILGRFVDAAWAYRFGPPSQDVIVVSLEQADADRRRLISQAFRFPAGYPSGRETAVRLGLAATIESHDEDTATVTVRADRLAYGVRLRVPGFTPDDDAFSVEPGHAREVQLRRSGPEATAPAGHITALNLIGRVTVVSSSAT
jgi:beta-mannosidase